MELSQSSMAALKGKLAESQREVDELRENLSTAEANAVAAANLTKATGKGLLYRYGFVIE